MFEAEIEAATELARGAGRILMDIYAKDFAVAYKGKNDPVTEADKLANAYLVEQLRKRFPDDGVVAEETEDRSDALKAGRCWYVDPVDGTKEFIAKNGEFSVMIGLAVDGAARAGVVFQPSKDKLYRGVVGGGAYLEQEGTTRELRVSDKADPATLKLAVSRSHRPESIEQLMERLGAREEMPSGSVGLKVGLIAEQVADLYVHISDRSSAWDACGPEAVLRGAGGRFADCGGQPFVYGGAEIANKRGILACNDAAFDAVAPHVAAVSKEVGFL